MWYFPDVWQRKKGIQGEPLGGNWYKKKTDESLHQYRKMIDKLTFLDVNWTPYLQHPNAREFEFFSLYRGWLKWGDVTIPYMPDRCMRQFGYCQDIPRPPLRTPYPSHDDIMRRIGEFMVVVGQLMRDAIVPQYPSDVVEGYLQWYQANSFLRLVGDPDEDEEQQQDVADEEQQQDVPDEGDPAEDEPPPLDGADVPQHHPRWVHDLVRFVREGLHSREIIERTRTYGRLYAMVGYPPEPPPRRQRGPGRQRHQ